MFSFASMKSRMKRQESLVVEQLATPELRVGCSRDHLVKLGLGGSRHWKKLSPLHCCGRCPHCLRKCCGRRFLNQSGWHSASLVGSPGRTSVTKRAFSTISSFFLRNTNKEMVVNRASENGGESGSATVVDMVEEPLVHHMPAVLLDTIM